MWFKVDDTLHAHMKSTRAGVEAMGLWVIAGSWSADQLTDGWVPEYMISRWSPYAVEYAQRLVVAGLWIAGEKDGTPGWWFHEWVERQPSRDEVEARRKADALRRARWRDKIKEKEGSGSHGVTSQCDEVLSRSEALAPNGSSQRDGGASQCDAFFDPSVDESSTPSDQLFSTPGKTSQCDSACPDPTRPDPSKEKDLGRATRKRAAHRLPSDWKPNVNHVRYAQEHDLDIDHEADQFRAHAEANDRQQRQWDAAFRQWLGNCVKWGRKPQLRAVPAHRAWQNPPEAAYDEDWSSSSEGNS